jgi:hypothetical protein
MGKEKKWGGVCGRCRVHVERDEERKDSKKNED